ncbi:alcohol dehydrogenase catalytic domain-containing protein [Nocardioides sp. LMS-CY]|uniref:zinc-dependent alcohol dehydrogenase n=1 Tax=Nocardioides sp. (strain LMS-CY) TaxID=2840457 RepID=UPI001BFFFE05|nr:alcohol dehydrogenase catalytic domain-containing protein [Nocardioides sp. LMS-CY]QWF21801.1 alcohol dehydrogenase catalytic domain-containing protein [Nocardioides sp. LMS-CY]
MGEGDRPVPRPGESLVAVSAVGICGSDLHWYAEGGIAAARIGRPLVLGHEFSGTVLGGELDGLRVAVDPNHPCGRCDTCAGGLGNLCPDACFAGHGATDGAMREYVAWPTRLLHPVPDQVSDVAAALLEPLGVALNAVELGQVGVGSTVAVVGCGPIGLLLVRLGGLAGAGHLLAVEPLPHRRAAALDLGADAAVGPGDDVDALVAQGARGLADVVFDVAGGEESMATALRVARPGGRVVVVGIPAADRIGISTVVARRKGLTVHFAQRTGNALPRALRLAEEGRVDLEALASNRIALADAPRAFELAESRQGLKTVVVVR